MNTTTNEHHHKRTQIKIKHIMYIHTFFHIYYKILIILLGLMILPPTSSIGQCPPPITCNTPPNQNDFDALVAFYCSTDGDNWDVNTGWYDAVNTGTNCDYCQWYGIACDGNNRVRDISFSINNINGPIPPELGSLSELEEFWIGYNNLTGPIPPELGDLSNLSLFNLTGNNLSGSIPSELGNLSSLTQLILAENNLSGSIPPELENLSNLTHLELFINNLSGVIPLEIGNCSSLEQLDLHSNNLNGSIPPELGNLSNLNYIRLHSNNLSSCFPEELLNHCSLATKEFYNNPLLPWQGDFNQFCMTSGAESEQYGAWCNDGITGNDPDVIDESCNCGSCTHPDYDALMALYNSTIGDNWYNNGTQANPNSSTEGWGKDCDPCQWYGICCDGDNRVIKIDLDGCVPDPCNFTCSESGGGNGVSGTLPDLNLQFLEEISLQFNWNLGGSIPDFSMSPNLKVLKFWHNNLNGPIPDFQYIPQLEIFTVGWNYGLTGSIPDFSYLPNLVSLGVSRTSLGNLPDFQELSTLEELYFREASQSGVPTTFTNLPNLKTYWAWGNPGWTGSNLPILSEHPLLEIIKLDNCGFIDTIPAEYGGLVNLSKLDLNDNNLSGCIPYELHNICSQITGDISNNPNLDSQSWDDFCILEDGTCPLPCPNIDIIISGPSTACIDMNIDYIFTFSGGMGSYTVDWTFGTVTDIDDGHIETITANASAMIEVTSGSDADGCDVNSSIPFSLTVNANPTASISGNLVICDGESTILTATGGTSYLWSTSETSDFITVSPNINTSYTVTVTDGNMCSDNNMVDVVVNTLPIADITGDLDICDGESTTLTATGGTSYIWSTSETSDFITVSPNSNTTYTVTVTDGNMCMDETTSLIVVNANPTIINPSPIEVCDEGGGQAIVDVFSFDNSITGGNTSYTVTWSENSLEPLQPLINGNAYMVTNSTLLYAQISDGQCSSEVIEVSFSLLSSITIINPSPIVVCTTDGNGIDINPNIYDDDLTGGNGSFLVTWSENNTMIPSISGLVFIEDNTFLYAQLSDGDCTSDIITVDFDISQNPSISAPSNPSTCDSGNGFGDFDLSSYDIEVNNGSGDDVIWSEDDLFNQIILVPNSYIAMDNKEIFVKVDDGICESEVLTVELIVNELPNISENIFIDVCQINESEVTIDLTQYDDMLSSGNGVGWFISDDGTPISDPSAFNTTVDIIIYAQATSPEECLSEIEPINIQLYAIDISCSNQPNGDILITMSDGVFPYVISWGGGSASDISSDSFYIQNLPTDTYTITVQDDNECENTCDVTIIESDCTHPDFNALLTIYNKTNGPNWTDNSGWSLGEDGSNCDPCGEEVGNDEWYGIECENNRVTSIILSDNKLSGVLPSTITLDSLLIFEVNKNEALTGLIPNFNNCTILEELFLSDNNFKGGFPQMNLPKLLYLDVSANDSLGGMLPDFTGIPNLEEIFCFGDSLTGNINNFQQLPKIKQIWAYDNDFTGDIPDFTLDSLERLSIEINQFSGELPALGSLFLDSLWVNENNLTGSIPDYSHMTDLSFFYASDNNLSGCYPGGIYCDLDFNFSGNVLLPYSGDYQIYCDSSGVQDGLPCNNGNGVIDEGDDCNCVTNTNCTLFDHNTFVLVSNTTCGKANGSATIMVPNGFENCTYLWNTNETSQTISSLNMGTYSVTVTDGVCEVIASGIVSFEEEPVIEWERCTGGSSQDIFTKIIVDSDNRIFGFGHTYSSDHDVPFDTEKSDGLIVELSQDGSFVSSNIFKHPGGIHSDWVFDIIELEDGNFIGVGELLFDSGGAWFFELDKSGNLISSFNGLGGIKVFNDIIQTKDGHFVLVGNSEDGDCSVLKINRTGDVIWQKEYGGTGYDRAIALVETGDNGFLVVGTTNSNDGVVPGDNHGESDVFVFRLDSIGNLDWFKSFGGSDIEQGATISKLADGNFSILTSSLSDDGDINVSSFGWKSWLFKIDLSGEILLSRVIGRSGQGAVGTMKSMDDGSILVSHFVQSFSTFDSISGYVDEDIHPCLTDTCISSGDLWVLRLNQDLDKIWSANFGGGNGDSGKSLDMNLDGDIVVGGATRSYDQDVQSDYHGDSDWWILKLKQPHYPKLTTLKDTSICQNQPIQLTVFDSLCNNCTYLWNDGNTDSIRMVLPIQSTTYSVSITGKNGCMVLDSILVYLHPTDTISIDTTILEGEIFTVGSSFYTESGTYYDTLTTLLTGCDSIITTTLLVIPDSPCQEVLFPDFGVNNNTIEACKDINFDISIQNTNNYQSYLWQEGQTSSTISLTLSQSMDYSFTLTDLDGCELDTSIHINVNNPPTATISHSTIKICNSDDDGESSVNLDTLVSGDSGVWKDENGVIVSSSIIDFDGKSIDTYTYTYTTNIAIDPCMDIELSLVFNVIDCYCDETNCKRQYLPQWVNFPTDNMVSCSNYTDELPMLSYSNNQIGDCLITGEVQATKEEVYNNCDRAIKYLWTYTTICGDVIDTFHTINIIDLDTSYFVNPPSDTTIDCDTYNNLNLIDLDYTNGSIGICEITGNTSANILMDEVVDCKGTIILQWTYTDDCDHEQSHIQTITVQDCAEITLEPEILWVTVGEPASINIHENDNINITTQTNITNISDPIFKDYELNIDGDLLFTINESFIDTITITYEVCDSACQICETTTLKILNEAFKDIILTDYISPNNDGINDKLRFNHESEIQNGILRIFNRWGDQIYHNKNYTNDWDANGYPGGIYFYVFEINGLVVKKTLTVVK